MIDTISSSDKQSYFDITVRVPIVGGNKEITFRSPVNNDVSIKSEETVNSTVEKFVEKVSTQYGTPMELVSYKPDWAWERQVITGLTEEFSSNS